MATKKPTKSKSPKSKQSKSDLKPYLDIVKDSGVSEDTLIQTPARIVTFLMGLARSRPARAALHRHGYTISDQLEGWQALQACGLMPKASFSFSDEDVRDAIIAVDAWDEDAYRFIRSALKHKFPNQYAFLVDGLGPKQGPEAVPAVLTLLDRIDLLASGKRKKAQKDDAAAVAALASRRLDKAECERVRRLCNLALGIDPTVKDDADEEALSEAEELSKHYQGLVTARGWFETWSECARGAIKSRRQLISLGLAERRSKKDEASDDEKPADEPKPAADPVKK